MTTPPTRTGGQLLVDQLRINGCDRIFTVPGAMPWAASAVAISARSESSRLWSFSI